MISSPQSQFLNGKHSSGWMFFPFLGAPVGQRYSVIRGDGVSAQKHTSSMKASLEMGLIHHYLFSSGGSTPAFHPVEFGGNSLRWPFWGVRN